MDRTDEREAAYRELREDMRTFIKRVMARDEPRGEEMAILPRVIDLYTDLF